jgi:hypothetical protein
MTTESTQFKGTQEEWRLAERAAWDADAQTDVWPIEYGERDEEDGTQTCVAFAFKKPDARLIAAAPELLEALTYLLAGEDFEEDDMRDGEHLWYVCRECNEEAADSPSAIRHPSDCAVGKGHAAIAKALGEPS